MELRLEEKKTVGAGIKVAPETERDVDMTVWKANKRKEYFIQYLHFEP